MSAAAAGDIQRTAVPAALYRRSSIRLHWLWESAAVVLLGLLPEIYLRLTGVSVLARDTLSSNMPLKQLAVEQLSDGRVPLWTSKLAAGFPLLADSVSLPLDPREVWYALLSPQDAYLAMLLTGQVLCVLLTYWYLRRRHRLGWFASMVGALVYLHAGIFFDEARLHSTAIAIDLLPGMIWLTDRLLDRPSVKRAVHLGLGWGALFLMGSVAYGAFLPLVCFVWGTCVWLFRRRRGLSEFGRFTLAYLGAGVWGIALSAYGLLPLMQFVSQSNRGGEYQEDFYFFRSVFYGLFGSHVPSVLVPPWTAFFYFGTIALAFVVLASGRRSSAYLRGLPWLALASFAVIALLETSFKKDLGQVVPAIFSIPVFRLSFFPVFICAVLAAYGIDRMDWDLARWRRLSVRVLFALQWVALAALALAACMLLVLKKEDLSDGYIPLYDNSVAYLRTALAYPFLVLIAIRAAGLGLTLLPREPLAAQLRARLWMPMRGGGREPLLHPRSRRALTTWVGPATRAAGRLNGRQLAAVLLIVELTIAWITIRPLVEETGAVDPFPVTPEVAFLKQHENPNGRAIEVVGVPGAEPAKPASSHDAISLYLDAPAFNGLSTASVYESLVVSRYARVFDHFPGEVTTGRAPTAILMMSDPSSRLLDALGVRWIYSESPLPPSSAYALRFEGTAYNVYERVNTVPRAFFVGRYQRLGEPQTQQALQAAALSSPSAPDLRREVLLPGTGRGTPSGPASYAPADITTDHDSTLDLQVNAPTAGYVYLADAMYSGWQASVDGRPAKIELADGYARAVRVGAGFHRIRFTYDSRPFDIGTALTLLALLVSIAAMLWWELPRLIARRRGVRQPLPDAAGRVEKP